jgi:hypothetical protein
MCIQTLPQVIVLFQDYLIAPLQGTKCLDVLLSLHFSRLHPRLKTDEHHINNVGKLFYRINGCLAKDCIRVVQQRIVQGFVSEGVSNEIKGSLEVGGLLLDTRRPSVV